MNDVLNSLHLGWDVGICLFLWWLMCNMTCPCCIGINETNTIKTMIKIVIKLWPMFLGILVFVLVVDGILCAFI
jgi:hypothetical protein